MEDKLLKSRWAILPNGRIAENISLLIVGEYIQEINPKSIPRATEIFDFGNAIISPAFINSHTHIPETLIRGICDDEDLQTWLFDHVWQVEPQMTAEDAKIGSLLGIAEMVSTGTIGFVDQFYFSDSIAEAVQETGVKALLAPSIFEGNAETKTIEKSFNKNIDVYKKWNGIENRIFVGFGPHAPYSVDEELFNNINSKVLEFDTFIHTHLNETKEEVKEAKENWGESPIERMDRWGVLDRTLAAHCVHVSDNDIDLLKKNDTTVLHNIQSNLKLGSGIAPIGKYAKNGINVVLGTDGNASNNNLSVLEEIRFASLVHKGVKQDPRAIPSEMAIKMATSNVSKIFPNESYQGKIEEGARADLVVFDLNNPRGVPIINAFSNMVYSLSDKDVILTMANGKILFKDNEFTTLNIEQVLSDAQKSTEILMEKANYQPKL